MKGFEVLEFNMQNYKMLPQKVESILECELYFNSIWENRSQMWCHPSILSAWLGGRWNPSIISSKSCPSFHLESFPSRHSSYKNTRKPNSVLIEVFAKVTSIPLSLSGTCNLVSLLSWSGEFACHNQRNGFCSPRLIPKALFLNRIAYAQMRAASSPKP